jgi:hypothetical protein
MLPLVVAAVDETSPPVVQIDAHPQRVVVTDGPRARVLFGFHASNETGFVCRLDDRPSRACISPKRYRVAPGPHVFRVAALGLGGAQGKRDRFAFRVEAAVLPDSARFDR